MANISAPVGALVLINQFLPGSVSDLIRSLPPVAVLAPLLLLMMLLVGVIWFAYAGFAAARDLNHLLRLHLADAAGGAGASGDDTGILETILDLT